MKRSHQIALTGLLTLVFLVWLAPASLIGGLLQQATTQEWNLADADGTLWNGHGVIIGKRGKDARQVSMPPLSWKLDGLRNGDLVFHVMANGTSIGQVQLGLSEWQLNLRGLGIEANDITPLLPGLLNKGEWQGTLNFGQITAQGTLNSTRISRIEMEWLHAATKLLPNGQLGTFVMKGHSENFGLSFSISSQEGPLMISGQGSHSTQQGFQFTGELIDNAGLTAQFPGFLSTYLQPAGPPGHYTLNVSKLKI